MTKPKKSRRPRGPSIADYERLEDLLGLIGNHRPYLLEAYRLLKKFKPIAR